MATKVGIAGLGAMGRAVARALEKGIVGLEFHAAANLHPVPEFSHIPLLNFNQLAQQCDLIVECLPAAAVPDLTKEVFDNNKNMVIISSAALIIYPSILDHHRRSKSRVIVPNGAIVGIDGVRALAQVGIKRAAIKSSKAPAGYEGAHFIVSQKIDLSAIKEKKLLFSGTALEAARGFPANVNVAATLSLAGIGPEKTTVEIWAVPGLSTNIHEVTVEGEFSTITTKVENKPDPNNRKTSMLATQSVIRALMDLNEPLVIL